MPKSDIKPIQRLKELNIKTNGQLDRIGVITRALDPDYVAQVFETSQSPGFLGELFELYKKTEKYDGKIQGLVERRKKAPTKFDSELRVVDNDVPRTEEVLDFLEEARGYLKEKNLKMDIMNGLLWGVNLGQQRWIYKDGKMFLKNPVMISASRFGQNNEFSFQDNNRYGSLYVQMSALGNDRIYIDDVDSGKMLKAVVSDSPGYHDLSGKLRPILKLFLFKDSVSKYWVEYSETHGFPTSIVKVNQSDYAAYEDELEGFMSSIGRNKFGILFNGMEYEIHANQSYGQIDVFKELLKYINDEISFAIVGQNLSENKGGSSTYASSVVGVNIEEDILIDDSEWVDGIINEYIIQELIKKNFLNYPIDNIKYYTKTPEKKNWAMIREKYELGAKIGLKGVSKKQLSEDLGITFAEDEEDSIDLSQIIRSTGVDKEEDAKRKAKERKDKGTTQSVADKV